MTYAKVRNGNWNDVTLRNLEGEEIDWVPKFTWVKSVCFDAMGTGLYVLTDDDDHYFTCHSIDLNFVDDIQALSSMEPDESLKRRLEVMQHKIDVVQTTMKELLNG